MLKVNRGDFLIKPFLKRNNIRASYQIISTIFPIFSIWLIVHQIINQPFSLLIKGFLLIPFLKSLIISSTSASSLKDSNGKSGTMVKTLHNQLLLVQLLNIQF